MDLLLPVGLACNVLVLRDRPTLGQIRHTDFLSLIHEKCACQSALHQRQEFG